MTSLGRVRCSPIMRPLVPAEKHTHLRAERSGGADDALLAGGFVTVYTDITERSLARPLTPARKDELEARVQPAHPRAAKGNESAPREHPAPRRGISALANSEARQRLITDAIPAAICLRRCSGDDAIASFSAERAQLHRPDRYVGNRCGIASVMSR